MNISEIKLELYVVVNQEGKFFRSVGYGGGGKSWVDTIDKAKTYTKIGQARSRVTWWNNTYPKYGMPVILKLTATGTEIINEVGRVEKAKEKKLMKEANRKKIQAKWALEDAERRLKQAQEEIKKIKGK